MQAKFNPSPKRDIRGNIYEIVQTLLGPVKESSAESRLLQVCISGRRHFYFILRRPLFELCAEYWLDGNITENCIWLSKIFIFFPYFLVG